MRTARPPAPRVVFEGDLEFLSLPELMHHICGGTRDRVVEIFDNAGLGVLIVQQGKVVRCSLGSATGMSAFCQLVKLRKGHFRVTRRVVDGPPDPAFAGLSWQRLLLEAAAIDDETHRRLGVEPKISVKQGTEAPAPPPSRAREALPSNDFSDLFAPPPPPALPFDEDETPTPVFRPKEKPLARLLDDATEAFLLHDYALALHLYERCLALDPGNAAIKRNVERVRWWLGKGR
ncbi:MAG: DUF4388 domain-containing protein [Byssovorax sp.]